MRVLMHCVQCGSPLNETSKFCRRCGASVPSKPVTVAQPNATATACPACAKPVRVGAKFCRHCGRELSRQVARESAVPIEEPSFQASWSQATASEEHQVSGS